VDVPTIHPGHLAGCGTMDICSDNSRGDGADTLDSDRHTAMTRDQWIQGMIILAVIVIGNLGGLWLVGAI